MQNDTLGHRGRKDDPLYRARRLLTKTHERLDDRENTTLIKRITRIGFGFRRLRNYRIRALLYAGRPNWNLLTTVEPR